MAGKNWPGLIYYYCYICYISMIPSIRTRRLGSWGLRSEGKQDWKRWAGLCGLSQMDGWMDGWMSQIWAKRVRADGWFLLSFSIS